MWKTGGRGLFLFLTVCDSATPFNTSDGRDLRPALDEHFIPFNGLRKRRKMSGSGEAKRRLALQTIYVIGVRGVQTRLAPYLHGGRRQHLLAVSDSNRDALKDVPVCLASWRMADPWCSLMIRVGAWAGEYEHKKIPGFVSDSEKRSWPVY